MPAPGQASYATIQCQINKANLDGKNPPKNPFMVHVAMKTAIDVYYFEVPCMLHCLINSAKQVNQQEYAGFWDKIKPTNQLTMQFAKTQLYGSVANSSDPINALASLVAASGFTPVN